jgi:guanylate kinase
MPPAAPGNPSSPPTDRAALRPEEVLAHAVHPDPLVVVISGPSGVGKDETIKAMKADGDRFHFVVTATTRPRREGEEDGVDYHFVTVAEFAEMIATQELLEHAVVYGDYKGIPKQQVREALAAGHDVVLRIDVQGAATIRRMVDGVVSIFMIAESMEELERRLRERKSEPADRLKMRIATAGEEMKRVCDFNYVVVNRRDRLEETVATIQAIITAEKARVGRKRATL